MKRVRTAVLISGRGSNLAALLTAAQAQTYPAEIALVMSNRPGAPGLEHAVRQKVPCAVVDHTRFDATADFEAELTAVLIEAGIELVCLAGFMRLLSPEFVTLWRDRLLNIHPSLLPAFRGLNTHERALAAGVRIHGATVHFVRAETDAGPIVAQGAVPVLPGDTAESLSARVLAVEHRLYPMALARVAGGAIQVVGEVVIDKALHAGESAMLLSPEGPCRSLKESG